VEDYLNHVEGESIRRLGQVQGGEYISPTRLGETVGDLLPANDKVLPREQPCRDAGPGSLNKYKCHGNTHNPVLKAGASDHLSANLRGSHHSSSEATCLKHSETPDGLVVSNWERSVAPNLPNTEPPKGVLSKEEKALEQDLGITHVTASNRGDPVKNVRTQLPEVAVDPASAPRELEAGRRRGGEDPRASHSTTRPLANEGGKVLEGPRRCGILVDCQLSSCLKSLLFPACRRERKCSRQSRKGKSVTARLPRQSAEGLHDTFGNTRAVSRPNRPEGSGPDAEAQRLQLLGNKEPTARADGPCDPAMKVPRYQTGIPTRMDQGRVTGSPHLLLGRQSPPRCRRPRALYRGRGHLLRWMALYK
jgi:hypothetical protein